jgi:tRNA-dihydrouridine synthase
MREKADGVLLNLPEPFFVLAPMDDVTDTAFRQVVAGCAKPDLFITEFVNVDGLQSPGRAQLLSKLQFSPKEQPIFAQLWGKNPENYYKTARQIVDGTFEREILEHAKQSGFSEMLGGQEERASRTVGTISEYRTKPTQQLAKSAGGVASSAGEQASTARFFGIDVNMGCPDKAVVKNGCGSALINNRELAGEIIEATKKGVAGKVPVSVKIRTGFSQVDFSWPEFILRQGLDMLTVHGRTTKEMSKVPARWEDIGKIREMRDKIAPNTFIVGNGDVLSRQQGEELAKQYQLDGIMIGRGVLANPFVFAKTDKWALVTPKEKAGLYKKHILLFAKTWPNGERSIQTLKKFAKAYINGFDGASDLRAKIMQQNSLDDILTAINVFTSD